MCAVQKADGQRENVHISPQCTSRSRSFKNKVPLLLLCTSKIACFLTGPTTRNCKRKAQDGEDVSGSAFSGSAKVPGTHVCGFDVQEMCNYVQELRVFAGLVRVQMCQSLLCFWCVCESVNHKCAKKQTDLKVK